MVEVLWYICDRLQSITFFSPISHYSAVQWGVVLSTGRNAACGLTAVCLLRTSRFGPNHSEPFSSSLEYKPESHFANLWIDRQNSDNRPAVCYTPIQLCELLTCKVKTPKEGSKLLTTLFLFIYLILQEQLHDKHVRILQASSNYWADDWNKETNQSAAVRNVYTNSIRKA
jgi:hypothetical protein